MTDLQSLTARADRLEQQLAALRAELLKLREELYQLHPNGVAGQPHCSLSALQAMASDLGPEFSSENPDALTGRGDEWFQDP
jgi:hypothetical protein